MTNEEAIRYICEHLINYGDGDEALKIINEALEKQMPKKVEKDSFGWYECAVCYNHGGSFLSHKFKWCPYCGQKLDWTEEKEETKNEKNS